MSTHKNLPSVINEGWKVVEEFSVIINPFEEAYSKLANKLKKTLMYVLNFEVFERNFY